MLLFPTPTEFRKRRGRAKPPPPLAGAPVLVAAEYLASTWVRLTFDRPVDAAPGVVGELLVADGPQTGTLWVGTGVTRLDAARVEVALSAYDAAAGAVTTLTADAATGIVSASDATPWAGASNVELPFP